jgi:sulfite reductase (ferredoxin)
MKLKISGPSTSSTLGWWEFRKRSGRFSDKVIKIPSRRGPDALRYILNDFEANANGNHFRLLCTRRKVFLRILKPLADTTNLVEMLILLIGKC